MQPPPPRSTRPYTLFPSTTLCRSHPRRIHGGPAAARDPMKLQHSLLVLALAVPLALLARTPAAGGGASGGTGPTADQATTAKLVYGLLSDSRYAYRPQDLDDALSQDIFKRYLEALDGGKMFFTAQDLKSTRLNSSH